MSRTTPERPFVLLVDDEVQFLTSSKIILRSSGVKNVLTESDSRSVLPLLEEKAIAAVVLDLTMPHVSGTELLDDISMNHPMVPIIVLTGKNELETAVACMKKGAMDYLLKPINKETFIGSVKRALEMHDLRSEVDSLKDHLLSNQLKHKDVFSNIITRNKQMLSVFQYIEVVSQSPQPVLITGETGVGKELIAKSIHDISGCEGEFVPVNVAGLDDTMFSDTLFGHRKGAYTGAADNRAGLIAKAAKGTLFLDEIGDLTQSSQVKLLRLLQENKYYQLGSDISKESDARIVVATNQDVQQLITSNTFRKDLYYRLRAHQIHIPPLRERKGDILYLLNHFLEEAASTMKKSRPTVPPELITLLNTYHFPGNIREFKAMVFDAVARHLSGILSMQSFKEIIEQERSISKTMASSGDVHIELLSLFDRFPTLKEAEEYLINEAMEQSQNNQSIAASLLGISRQALNKRLIRGDYKINS